MKGRMELDDLRPESRAAILSVRGARDADGKSNGYRRLLGVPLSMSSIRLEYLDADASHRTLAANVFVREEPNDEEDEGEEEDDDEKEDDEGYSE